MRKVLILFCLCSLAGCIQQLTSNLERSNELMCENIQAMSESKKAIEENTRQINRSTGAIIFGELMAGAAILFVVGRFSRKLFKKWK